MAAISAAQSFPQDSTGGLQPHSLGRKFGYLKEISCACSGERILNQRMRSKDLALRTSVWLAPQGFSPTGGGTTAKAAESAHDA